MTPGQRGVQQQVHDCMVNFSISKLDKVMENEKFRLLLAKFLEQGFASSLETNKKMKTARSDFTTAAEYLHKQVLRQDTVATSLI